KVEVWLKFLKRIRRFKMSHSEENLDDQNESDPDDNRISKIQQGINIVNEKLKEYNNYNCFFLNNIVANLEVEKQN
ncbi:16_t:CDS:1, partial [Gigaspora margarita]